MRVVKFWAAAAAAAGVSSCGGGDSSSAPPVVGPAPTPTLTVTLSQPTVSIEIEEGGSASFDFTATYTGNSNSPVVADVDVGGRRYVLDGALAANGKSYTANFTTAPFPAGGKTRSQVTFRLCTSASCSTVYPGSTKTFAVDLDVALADWGMFQRGASHTGYVAVEYDPAEIEPAWQWSLPAGGRINEPAATRGRIFATATNPVGDTIVYALNSADGSIAWTSSLGDQSDVSGPSVAAGKLYVTTLESSSNDNPQWVLDARDGTILRSMSFASQWHDFTQPTIFDGQVFVAAGYYGNEVYAFDGNRGTLDWMAQGSADRIWDMQAVAADERYAYYYSGAMDVFDRRTGARVLSMADPALTNDGTTWPGSPILDGDGGVFGFSSGMRRKSYADGYVWFARLAGYSVNTGRQSWVTNAAYVSGAALDGDTIFAARSDAARIDAIDKDTGAVRYSILLPDEETIVSNIVVAEGLLFATSENRIFAIDLKSTDRSVVWSGEGSGKLAITPDNHLLVAGNQILKAFALH